MPTPTSLIDDAGDAIWVFVHTGPNASAHYAKTTGAQQSFRKLVEATRHIAPKRGHPYDVVAIVVLEIAYANPSIHRT